MVEWRIIHKAETASTNIDARQGKPGDVFTADFQSAGRGRLDHKWLGERGANLAMSAVIDVSGIEPHEAATLPLVIGLAVAEGLEPFAGPLMLKWPNDIYLSGRKLAGILCERNGDSVIAGIGVNVRQREFPAEIASRAISLVLSGSDASVEESRDAILAALGNLVFRWRRNGFAAIWPRIAAIDHLKGREVAVRQVDNGAAIRGVCGGIRRDGSLDVGGEAVWAGEATVENIS
ncbi:MAG: biotin--[acetyl-CoA-carboxylase] ligase [Kiritimatiellae bacterium]|nr:biotin--[acetyl-CoA-carboxylase] ligase [Kiritimatiellia bacterium]